MTTHAASRPNATHGASTGILVIAALFVALLLALICAVLLTGNHSTNTSATVPLHHGKLKRAPETIGRASFPLSDGKTCREMVFDRHNNDIIDSETRPCRAPRFNDDHWLDMLPQVAPRRARNGFSWGRS